MGDLAEWFGSKLGEERVEELSDKVFELYAKGKQFTSDWEDFIKLAKNKTELIFVTYLATFTQMSFKIIEQLEGIHEKYGVPKEELAELFDPMVRVVTYVLLR